MMDRRFCVAPMMSCTDRHFRVFTRLLSRRAVLYTEMVAAAALLHGEPSRWLAHDPVEHPLALQLGGSEPGDLARCAAMGQQAGFDEINLNVGCPSDRVQAGRFGACLMAEPGRVADCVAAMRVATDLPVSVKTRIGIDHRDSYDTLCGFVERVSGAGCGVFIVHARKAWLRGLSPRQNRNVPPLRYDRVHSLKADFPQLEIIINGGFDEPQAALGELDRVDGVMLGRAVYANPWLMALVDPMFYAEPAPARSRHEALQAYLPYVERQLALGVPLNLISRHLMGLFQGLHGARHWRRALAEGASGPRAGTELIRRAASLVDGEGEARRHVA